MTTQIELVSQTVDKYKALLDESDASKIKRYHIKIIIDFYQSCIMQSLMSGNSVLTAYGSMRVYRSIAKTGTHPKTKAVIAIPAKNRIKINMNALMEDSLNP